jgi:hypothetical protein
MEILTLGAVAAAWLALGDGVMAFGFARARRLRVPAPASATTHPTVVFAATGPLPGLERLRDALVSQSVGPAAVIFAVECESDPAFARLGEVFADFPAPVEVLVAGEAVGGGQKSRNLAQALDHPLARRGYLVLADVDIAPTSDWLANLMRPLEVDFADIVTGYRWPIPGDGRLATLVGTWIDRGIAALPKPGGLVWGGSVALTAATAARIDLADHLRQEISDDLALAKLAHAKGLRVLFRGSVLLATPFAHDFHSLLEWGKRQYQMTRLYAPSVWAMAAAITIVNLAGSVAMLALAATSPAWLGAYGALMLLALASDRERRGQARAAGIEVAATAQERALRGWALALPLIHLVHLAAIVAALDGRTIRWGHWVYRMQGRRVVGIDRKSA